MSQQIEHLSEMIAGSEGLDNFLVQVHGMDAARHHHIKPIRWLVALTHKTVIVRDREARRGSERGGKERETVGREGQRGREEERKGGREEEWKRGREAGMGIDRQADRQIDKYTKADRQTDGKVRT